MKKLIFAACLLLASCSNDSDENTAPNWSTLRISGKHTSTDTIKIPGRVSMLDSAYNTFIPRKTCFLGDFCDYFGIDNE